MEILKFSLNQPVEVCPRDTYLTGKLVGGENKLLQLDQSS